MPRFGGGDLDTSSPMTSAKFDRLESDCMCSLILYALQSLGTSLNISICAAHQFLGTELARPQFGLALPDDLGLIWSPFRANICNALTTSAH